MKQEWKAYDYSYRIHWSPGERGYIASVAEFPTMQSPAEATPQAALNALMSTVIEDLHQREINHEPPPESLALGATES